MRRVHYIRQRLSEEKGKISALGIRVVKGHESRFLPVEPPPTRPAAVVAAEIQGQGGLFEDLIAELDELRAHEQDDEENT